jgi:hypothetical protein
MYIDRTIPRSIPRSRLLFSRSHRARATRGCKQRHDEKSHYTREEAADALVARYRASREWLGGVDA